MCNISCRFFCLIAPERVSTVMFFLLPFFLQFFSRNFTASYSDSFLLPGAWQLSQEEFSCDSLPRLSLSLPALPGPPPKLPFPPQKNLGRKCNNPGASGVVTAGSPRRAESSQSGNGEMLIFCKKRPPEERGKPRL